MTYLPWVVLPHYLNNHLLGCSNCGYRYRWFHFNNPSCFIFNLVIKSTNYELCQTKLKQTWLKLPPHSGEFNL